VLSLAWRLHVLVTVRDATLRGRLRPTYPLGCKRIPFSNDWYPTLAREHVDVVTGGIARLDYRMFVRVDAEPHAGPARAASARRATGGGADA